jgi:integrase
MPAKYEMTWEPGPCRWRKVYRGHTYTISCRKLGVQGSKEASRQAANAWWVKTKAEIDGHQPPHPHADFLDLMARRLDFARRHDPARVRAFEKEIARVKAGEHPSFMEEYYRSISPVEIPEDPGDRHYSSTNWDAISEDDKEAYFESLDAQIEREKDSRAIDPHDELWVDRIRHQGPAPVPVDKTVGEHVRLYLEMELIRTNAGALSVSEYKMTETCLHAFRDWLGAELSIETIDVNRWESYWLELVDWKASVEYKKKRLRHARAFLGWLTSKDLIPTIKNLHHSRFRFDSTARAVPTMTVEEVQMLVANAPGQLRLHLLLMANCGMTQVDISDLRQDEVDWAEGRIIRKRSKTGDIKNVPIVNYKLWPLTWELLQQHRSDSDEYTLLTKSGGRWLVDYLEGTERHKADNIATKYYHLKKKLKFFKPLKLIRKTSASIIERHDVYGRYTDHFLGHTPRDMAERHYVVKDPTLFDRAVEWLGQQYRFVE